ncbi:MAG: hypothetical protein ACLUQ2_02915 [Klebsiella pneumoniae]
MMISGGFKAALKLTPQYEARRQAHCGLHRRQDTAGHSYVARGEKAMR